MKKIIFCLLFTCLVFISVSIHAQRVGSKNDATKNQVFTLTENANKESLKMPWRNCIAVAVAHLLLRNDCVEHLAEVQKVMGYRYCRFHGIFDDQMDVVKRNPDSTLTFQWHQVDQVYDLLLEMGIRPFVELNPMPTALASGTQRMFWYQMNVTPPKSYDEWALLIEEFGKHLVSRYGIDEVRKWYFEVWNEPNLSGFWTGNKDDYFKLYTVTAQSLKKIDSQLRVGGPASSSVSWLNDIINYTSANKVPLDFISTHLYAQDEQMHYPNRKGSPYAVGDYFATTIKTAHQEVKNSVRPDLEFHITEWNSLSAKDSASVSWDNNPNVDNLYAASFIVRNALELDNECSSLTHWAVTDIDDFSSIPLAPFSENYGLVNINGIPKASYNAYAFLRKMEGYKLDVHASMVTPSKSNEPKEKVSALGKGISAVNDFGTIRIILWNQNFTELTSHENFIGKIEIPFLDIKKQYVVVSSSIRAGEGSPYETWQAMGVPQNLTREQQALLKAHSSPTYSLEKIKTDGEKIFMDFSLTPGEVKFIEISPKGQVSSKHTYADESSKLMNKKLSEKSKK